MKKFYLLLILVFVQTVLLFAQPCTTNFLNNPSFESPTQPSLGNNFPAPNNTFNGWNIPSATSGVPVGGFNVIRVDGTTYSGGPNNASGVGNQYVDINSGGGFVQQNFTLTCTSDITFSGWFSRREPGGTGFSSRIDINNGATVVATSTVVAFTSNESEEVWKQVTGTANLPAGNYTFRFFVDDFANIDDAFLCTSPGCVLPISLLNFSGISNKCADILNWKTSTEINSSRFEIEHSRDGINYNVVGTVPSKNATIGSSYSFQYNAAGSAASYYRLKAVDLDGRTTQSSSIKLTSNCDLMTVNIYPNPVTDFLNINVSNASSPRIIVYSMDGKIIVPISNLKDGTNKLNVGHLVKGIYILKLLNDTETKIIKLSKM